MGVMQDFYSYQRGFSELPISTMRPGSAVKAALGKQLEAFESLELSSEDQGFLRLAQTLLEPIAGSISRSCSDRDVCGLIS
ncbi:MAG: hypothetical protein ACI8XO_003320 [Verrucomicrobiales bacterium]|jgi:hypothetical protein